MREQREAATSSRGFDPGRQAELGALGRHALALTQREHRPSTHLEELIATGYSYVDRPPAEIGRRPLLELAGRLLRLAGDDPGRELRRALAHAMLTHELGEEPLPDTLTSATWDATARFQTYRLAAEAILKALTVARPPPADAALVWHPPRTATVEDVQALAAAALAGPTPRHPAEALELLEWKKSIRLDTPEELVGDALMAHRRLCLTGDRAHLEQIVGLLADTNWLIEPDESEYQITAVARRAATVIDGAGFAGGATANLVELVDHLHSGLTVIPGTLGHLAREPEGKADRVLDRRGATDRPRRALDLPPAPALSSRRLRGVGQSNRS